MHIKLISLIIFLFLSLGSFAQSITREEYIQRYQLLAIEEMNRSGIPASITMAQGCLESSDGNSELSRKSNNHFGIKCKSGWKGKKVYYDDDERDECFRKYRTVEESYKDHTDFLMNNPRYATLFLLNPRDYKGWAKGLKKAGYATAKHYSHSLIKIIETHKLYRLDEKLSFKPLAKYEQKKVGKKGYVNRISIDAFAPHKIEKRNHVKSVVAREGDTYETLAQELGLEAWMLYKYNSQTLGYTPTENEVVYIKPKKRRATKGNWTHRVEAGETLHYISQMYGINLKQLRLRNRIKKGHEPLPGEIIYLRKWGKSGK